MRPARPRARSDSQSLRSRLTRNAVLLYFAAGVLLLAVEYGVLRTVIERSVSANVGGSSLAPGPPSDAAVTAVMMAADELVVAVMIVSGVVVAAFAGLAGVLTWRMSSASLSRIADVSRLARHLSENDLGERLNLPGPRDEVKDLGDTFDEMLERLGSAFAAQERFVANASHELRTPLAAIRTALEAPLVQGRFSAEATPAVERALQGTQRAEVILGALLQLARSRAIDTSDMTLVRLDEVVAALSDTFTRRAQDKGIELRVETSEAPVQGDETLLTQMVMNLLDNAVRYNVPNGHVAVTARLVEGCPTLRVENSAEELTGPASALLEPFNRGSRSRVQTPDDQHGLGLGLSIVQSIATRHGGVLQIEGGADGVAVQVRFAEVANTPR